METETGRKSDKARAVLSCSHPDGERSQSNKQKAPASTPLFRPACGAFTDLVPSYTRVRRVPTPPHPIARQTRLDPMMEPRYTSVMRSTRSGNYYNVPISPEVLAQSELGPELATFANYDGAQHEAVAAAWGSATMRRLPAMGQRRDLNAGLDSTSGSKDPQSLQPAFAFDLNKLVASLTKSSSSSCLGSSFTSSRGAGASGEPQPEPMPEARIHVLPVEPVVTPQRQRGRRDALSGEELSRSYGPPTGPENSIITYSLNKRKQKRLAAKALAAASVNGPNFEYVVADAGNEYQPQYVPRYVPQYQADTMAPSSVAGSSSAGSPPSRRREPSVDQESYAF